MLVQFALTDRPALVACAVHRTSPLFEPSASVAAMVSSPWIQRLDRTASAFGQAVKNPRSMTQIFERSVPPPSACPARIGITRLAGMASG